MLKLISEYSLSQDKIEVRNQFRRNVESNILDSLGFHNVHIYQIFLKYTSNTTWDPPY